MPSIYLTLAIFGALGSLFMSLISYHLYPMYRIVLRGAILKCLFAGVFAGHLLFFPNLIIQKLFSLAVFIFIFLQLYQIWIGVTERWFPLIIASESVLTLTWIFNFLQLIM